MKKIVFLSLFVFLALSIKAQETTVDPDAPIMKFDTETIDYGTIEKGSDGYKEFKFTNIGKSPLKIERVKSSCGCTVPSYPKEAIMPGESNVIKVKYNTSKVGRFSKSISIFTNAQTTRTVIRIKGNVIDPNTSAPIIKQKSILSAG